MEARLKSGKVITGKLAETFVRNGLAKEKKRGNIQNLKPKKAKENAEEIEKA